MAQWFREHTDELYLSTITVAEIEAGIAKLRSSIGAIPRATLLNAAWDPFSPERQS